MKTDVEQSRFRLAMLVTLALVAVIAFLCLMPITPKSLPVSNDKLGHLAAFAALAFPLTYAKPHRWFAVWSVAVVYGAVIEVVQPLTGRTAEWGDLLADAAGAALGVLLAVVLVRWRMRRPKAFRH